MKIKQVTRKEAHERGRWLVVASGSVGIYGTKGMLLHNGSEVIWNDYAQEWQPLSWYHESTDTFAYVIEDTDSDSEVL